MDFIFARARFAHRANIFLGVVIGNGLGRMAHIAVIIMGMIGLVMAVVVMRAVVTLCGVVIGVGIAILIGRIAQIDHFHTFDGRHFGRGDGVACDRFGLGLAGFPATGAACALWLCLFLGLIGHGFGVFAFLAQKRFAIGHGDLVIIGVNFRKREEAVAVSAVIHKGGLQRGFDPRDLCQINISRELSLVQRLEIEFFDLDSVNHDNPGLFRVCGIDEHLLSHFVLARDRPRARPGGALLHRTAGAMSRYM